MQSDISFSSLYKQAMEMRKHGNTVKDVEVGPETWKFMLDTCEAGTGKKWPSGRREKIKEGWFAGIHVTPANVPEGKIWPK